MRSAFLLAICAASAGAAPPLDAEFKSPLTWRIVIDVPEHPLVPAEFRSQLCADVRMALQTGFEKDLCRVEVIDLAARKPETWEPLWKSFHERGLPALDGEAPRSLDGVKTHFVKLSILDGKPTAWKPANSMASAD